MLFYLPHWELTIFQLINQKWRCAFFDFLMPIFSDHIFLWACAVAALCLGLSDKKKFMHVLICLGLAVALSDLTCSFVKNAAGRVRPLQSVAATWFQDSGKWHQLPADFHSDKMSGSSYPSAHASNAVAVTLVLYVAYRRKVVWIAPLLIGYSRIYLGKHFPVDVAAGWITGMAATSAFLPLYSKVANRFFSR